jgi:hypothetical protein
METTKDPVSSTRQRSFARMLDRRLQGRQCVLAWVVATVIFVGMIALLGGPTENDATESAYSTWAVAHGDFACTYPPLPAHGSAFLPSWGPEPNVSPLWPLVSGGFEALTSVGSSQRFPSAAALGTSCAHAYVAMYPWAHNSFALVPTIGFGYLSWCAVLAGVVALIRASGRGRSGWEVAGVILVALTPLVWQPVLDEYHPQDLLAMGLILLGLAFALRRSWICAGVMLGLAVLTQQFALLVLAPLFVIASARNQWRLAVSAVVSGFLVAVPFVTTSTRSWHAIAIGTGNSPSFGGTVVRYLRLHDTGLVLVSRVFPILLAAAFAWWVHRRIGSRCLQPVPFLSLMASCVSLRLVFEQNMFGYYLMALAVLLILLQIVSGRIRGELVAWIAMAVLLYNPVPWGLSFNARSWGTHLAASLPAIGIAIAMALIVWDAVHRRVRWYLLAWFVVAVAAVGEWPPWSQSFRPFLHPWMAQLILVPTGVALAVWPLIGILRTPAIPLDDSRLPLDFAQEELQPAVS